MNLKQLSSEVKIVEVGPRDGLQNEKMVLKTEIKAEFISDLISAGLKTIEATSFVRPDKIPQMKDAKELFSLLTPYLEKGIHLPCLVPNMKGLDSALDSGVKEIAVFTATSDSFNKKNINATVDESCIRLMPVMKKAIDNNVKIRGYISTAFGCPYEGKTSVKRLCQIVEKLFKNGCYEISIGDTIGVGTVPQVQSIIRELKKIDSLTKFSMHFHDTRGMALANTLVALEEGITVFDSSAGGLGGCPYAKGATGNVATEDMVYLFDSLGIKTGVDIELLSKASLKILGHLGHTTSSKFLKAYQGSGE